MTAYFDENSDRLNEITRPMLLGIDVSPEASMRLRDWEQTLVYDVLVATELKMPAGRGLAGMPMEFVGKIKAVILAHGVDSLPPGIRSLEIETVLEHVNHMDRLVYELHTIFHELAQQPHAHFGKWSDNPKAPVDLLCELAEESLWQLAPEERRICALCGNHGGVSEPCEMCGVEQGQDDD